MFYALRHIASIVLLPFTVCAIVPFFLLLRDPATSSLFDLSPVRIVAIAGAVPSFVVGLILFVSTVSLFARLGRGTLAPWDPPRVLVVEGVYRYVRNPMISGVLFLLLAEVLLTGSRRVLAWLALFFVVNLTYIPLVEEPGLARRFGKRYRTYQQHVPRWFPRLTAWTPPWAGDSSPPREGHSPPAPN